MDYKYTGLHCAEGRNQLSEAWELTPGNVTCFAKHGLIKISLLSFGQVYKQLNFWFL